MLSSIHPLGERARHNRWGLTVGAFLLAAIAAGAVAGALLGAVGTMLAMPAAPRLGVLGATVVVAAAHDQSGVSPPGPQRQVDERWIGSLRGWVYGAGFGAQLGAGGATYIVTWLLYASAAAAILTGSITGGTVVGAGFGSLRAAPLVAARWIDRPSRLGRFHRTMAQLGPRVRLLTPLAAVAVALSALSRVI